MRFEIKNRWSMKVQFECELEAKFETESYRIQIGAAIKEAYKGGADLSGAALSSADLRGANLRGAVLSDADLSDADLRGAVLSDADLSDADLRGADLSGADLRGANLRGAVLSGADLSGANLRDANLRDGLDGIPSIPNIHQAVYESASKPKALDMSTWHTCKTTHCRAGWVVTLAGDAGKALEWALGTPAAAALIYVKSDPKLAKVPDFYSDNETSLADMRKLAEASA